MTQQNNPLLFKDDLIHKQEILPSPKVDLSVANEPMTYESNPIAELINLFQEIEFKAGTDIELQNQKMKKVTQEMKDIQRVLSALAKDTNESKRVDWKHDPAKQALVDRLCDNPETAYLFERGVYEWKETKLENLTERLNSHISRVDNPTMQQIVGVLQQSQHDVNDILEIMAAIVKEWRESIRQIQGNIQRARS